MTSEVKRMAFGKKLEAALKMKDVRPGTLATRTGINKNTIYSMIQRDTAKVDLEVIKTIANALDLDLDFFLKPDQEELADSKWKESTDIGGLTKDEHEFLSNFAELNEQNRHILLVIASALLRDQARASDSPA